MIDLSNATHSPKGEFRYSRLSSFPKASFAIRGFPRIAILLLFECVPKVG